MNTLSNEKMIIRKKINQKLSFPNIFNLTTNSNNLTTMTSQKNISNRYFQNHYSYQKYPNFYRISKNLRNEIRLVHMLNIEQNLQNTIKTDLNLKKQKLKIDNNNSILKFRLGLLKKKEDEEEENKDKDFNNKTMEKEKEKENNIEKIENDLKDMERILEKKLEEKNNSVIKAKNECKNINDELNKINEEIEQNKMEEKILVDYAEEFDANYEKTLSINDENNEDNFENNYIKYEQQHMQQQNNHNHNNTNKNGGYINEMNRKRKEIENLNKIKAFKQKREDKKKELKENIIQKEKIKLKLEAELIEKKNILNKVRKEFLNIRNNLINKYHIKLYEGINIHNEGLPSIIKDIWKLDSEVNTNFMPTYLDSKSISFLFQKAKQSIEINRIRQAITEAEKDFIVSLENWRHRDNIEFNTNNMNTEQKKGNKFFNINKKDDGKTAPLDESELFKTKISDISLSYLEAYPKTKQFIIDYRNNHPQKFKKEMPKLEVKTLKFKSFNIPNKVLEKNKKIEKLKYLLECKLEQCKLNDIREVERLNKEFILNNYQTKFKVNIETLFGALFGDKKNEMLIYNARLEKDYRDNNKIIRFHTKYNSIKLK
jgi:hypothetical protein